MVISISMLINCIIPISGHNARLVCITICGAFLTQAYRFFSNLHWVQQEHKWQCHQLEKSCTAFISQHDAPKSLCWKLNCGDIHLLALVSWPCLFHCFNNSFMPGNESLAHILPPSLSLLLSQQSTP